MAASNSKIECYLTMLCVKILHTNSTFLQIQTLYVAIIDIFERLITCIVLDLHTYISMISYFKSKLARSDQTFHIETFSFNFYLNSCFSD